MIIHDIEQGSEEWHSLRAGLPTASEFSKLITSTGAVSESMADYARVLAAEKFAGHAVDGWEGNRYTERGKELEDHARNAYMFITGSEVSKVGFVTDNLKRYGCSPDRFVGDDGLLEIKCQIAKEHIKSLEYYAKHGKPPTTYIAQIQGQMFVCERQWVDLMFYHPDLPHLIIRQQPDLKLVAALRQQLAAVEAERNIVLKFLREFDDD